MWASKGADRHKNDEERPAVSTTIKSLGRLGTERAVATAGGSDDEDD
jgi:hypothetical protein